MIIKKIMGTSVVIAAIVDVCSAQLYTLRVSVRQSNGSNSLHMQYRCLAFDNFVWCQQRAWTESSYCALSTCSFIDAISMFVRSYAMLPRRVSL